MNLRDWESNGWPKPHRTSPKEIRDLLRIVDREISDADYLNACRNKRNDADYRLAGTISDTDAKELLEFTVGFRKEVIDWLKANYPELMK